MGSSSSKSETQNIVNEIINKYNLEQYNEMTNIQQNNIKSEIISNYIQNLTSRNINREDVEENLKRHSEASARSAAENIIAYKNINIIDNSGEVLIQQNAQVISKITASFMSLMSYAANTISKSDIATQVQSVLNGDVDTSTFNENAQKAISNVVNNQDLGNTAQFEQSLPQNVSLPEIKLLDPKIYESSKEDTTLNSSNLVSNDVNQVVKNIAYSMLANDQQFVQHLNNSVTKMLENITENSRKINDTVQQITNAEATGTNTLSGESLNITGNSGKVAIIQDTKVQAEALQDMVTQSVFDSSQSAILSATMADILGMTASTKSETIAAGSQDQTTSSSNAVSSSSDMTSKQSKSVTGVVIVLVVFVVIIAACIGIYFYARNKREKQELEHGYVHRQAQSQIMQNLGNRTMSMTR